MIKQRTTVLILGAGASAPYGYPLGAGLVARIVELTAPARPGASEGGLHPILRRASGRREQVNDFHERLRGSETSSIDDFLESNPAYQELGKLCIAAALTVWGPLNDFPTPADQHWYRYLWERLRQGAPTPERFRENRVRIITYNYDRSFERYFAGVLRRTYPDLASADPTASEALRAQVLPVVHVHGSLGEVGDQMFTVPERTQLNDLRFYREVAAGLRIVHEDEPSDEYRTAHAWLQEATAIIFLGFGYHPTNVQRLAVVDQLRGRSGWFLGGTALGLRTAEITRAEALLAIGGAARILYDVDCRLYLREYAPLE